MTITLVGLSHKTAPIEVRERVAIGAERLGNALSSLVDRETIEEGMILSTCNRVEVITAASKEPEQVENRVREFFSEYNQLPAGQITPHLYTHTHQLAVRHVFRVASSLDSMVIGEAQILGQMKDAYARAVELGTVGKKLNTLMQKTFAVAKRVRTETGIGAAAVSVSHAAVELAQKIFEDLGGKHILLVGAGEMAELALQYFHSAGASQVTVTSRTLEHARSLAGKLGVSAAPLGTIDEQLTRVDIVLISLAAQGTIMTAQQVAKAMERRKGKSLLLVDISVPRVLEPQTSALENVFAFDIDDLQSVVAANLRERGRESAAAESIIDKEVALFVLKLRSMDAAPSIRNFKDEMRRIAELEFARHRRRLGELTEKQEQALWEMVESITNKLSHPVVARLHDLANNDGSNVPGVPADSRNSGQN